MAKGYVQGGLGLSLVVAGIGILAGCGVGTCDPGGDSGCGYPVLPEPAAVGDYQSCVASGGVVQSREPPLTCRGPDGRVYTEFFSRAGSSDR